ncbi:MAG: sigma 54-interacting transcriptional regulator [Henriciella sp.]|uniref:sigma 54-interacting transcriptional regulator n=1 Tax=Henriciella sp. TaxID=1968823 RepID=UPI003C722195
MSQKTVLLAEDDASIRLVVNQTLVTEGYQVRATSSADALERWIRNGEGDVVVTDVYLGDTAIFELLPSIKLARPELPVIVMSGQNTILTAASAARHGVFDYLPKPFDIDQLSSLVGRALKGPAKRDAASADSEGDASLPLIGRSDPMQEVYRIISRVMNTDLTVLIEGESGTGKELAAQAIHQLGAGKSGKFKALDLAAMPTEQISKDLFGTEDAPGIAFDPEATLYLDEIGDLPAEAQTQLVKLMREAGGARIIASTRQPLAKLVDEGRFREDLFYRINVVRIFMPSLRQRKEDIPELVRAFLLRAQRKGLSTKQIEPAAMDLMMAYDWPGNVRELENLIMRLAALSPDVVISQREIERELRAEAMKDISSNSSFEKEVESLLHRFVMGDLLQASPDDSKIHQGVMEQVERPLIKLALSVTSGNKLRTAALLGVNRNTLRARINSLGIADD